MQQCCEHTDLGARKAGLSPGFVTRKLYRKRRPSAREDGGVSGVSSSCGARGPGAGLPATAGSWERFWRFVCSDGTAMRAEESPRESCSPQGDPRTDPEGQVHPAAVWKIPMDRGAWWAAVHGVAKSRIRLSD